MIPPYPGTLPKGTSQVAARHLSVGDLIFLESAASGTPVRSLITKIRGNRFLLINGLNPEPYEVVLLPTKFVWTLKQKPRRTVEQMRRDDEDLDRPREPIRGHVASPKEPEDFRAYWNWDPKDKRSQQEYTAVEEREWKRLRDWWEKKKQNQTRKHSRPRRVDSKVVGWYKTLNVRAGISLKELKAAYRKLAFKYHPDRCKDSDASDKFKLVTEAYSGLLCLFEDK